MAEHNSHASPSPRDYPDFFAGWTGSGVLAGAYVAAEFGSLLLGGLPGLVLFVAWSFIFGPALALLVIGMTLRALVLAPASIWRRLIVLSAISVPVAIIVITLTGGRGVARFFGLG